MSRQESTEPLRFYYAVGTHSTGFPDVAIRDDDIISIYPTGIGGGGLHMSMPLADWRRLNQQVEAEVAAANADVDGAA